MVRAAATRGKLVGDVSEGEESGAERKPVVSCGLWSGGGGNCPA
jgi:hypothetical protein